MLCLFFAKYFFSHSFRLRRKQLPRQWLMQCLPFRHVDVGWSQSQSPSHPWPHTQPSLHTVSHPVWPVHRKCVQRRKWYINLTLFTEGRLTARLLDRQAVDCCAGFCGYGILYNGTWSGKHTKPNNFPNGYAAWVSLGFTIEGAKCVCDLQYELRTWCRVHCTETLMVCGLKLETVSSFSCL